MDRHLLVPQPLEVEGNAHPIRGGTTEECIELHYSTASFSHRAASPAATAAGTKVSTLIGRIGTTNKIAAHTTPTAVATKKGSNQLPPLRVSMNPAVIGPKIPAKLPRVLIMPKIDPARCGLNSSETVVYPASALANRK